MELALAIALPLTAYLLHRFPISITIHRTNVHTIDNPHHSEAPEVSEEKIQQTQQPSINDFIAAFNEAIYEIGGDEDGK